MSICLVLEGGAMRGVFTAGVLDFFLEKKIEPDACIGVFFENRAGAYRPPCRVV